MNEFDPDPEELAKSVREYLRSSGTPEEYVSRIKGKIFKKEQLSRRKIMLASANLGVVTACSIYWLGRIASELYNSKYTEVIIIYNNDPVLENLKKAMHGERSRLNTSRDNLVIPSPLSIAIAEGALTDGIIIAVRSDTKVFPGGFHGVYRHIDVVVSTSFLQSCPVEVLADNFIRMLKIKLMQPLTEVDEILGSSALVRIP